MNVNIMEKVTEEREKTLAFLLLNKCVFSLLILSVGLSYQFFFHLCLHEREAGERERERMREQEHESERESFTLFIS